MYGDLNGTGCTACTNIYTQHQSVVYNIILYFDLYSMTLSSDTVQSLKCIKICFKDLSVLDENQPVFNLVAQKEKAHDQDVNSISWHPHDDVLASCSDDGTVKLWRLVEG